MSRDYYVQTDRDDGSRAFTGPLSISRAQAEKIAREEAWPTYVMTIVERAEVKREVSAYTRHCNQTNHVQRWFPTKGAK